MRKDGRTSAQIRTLACEHASLAHADGSARFELGKTAVLAAVYGPAEVTMRKDKPDRATLEVIFKPKTGSAGVANLLLEQRIKGALEAVVLTHLHPHSLISVIIQELHDDGALFACAINGACVALLDAGVPLKACVAAATVAFDQDNSMTLDPTLAEEQSARAVLTFASTNESADPAFVATAAVGSFTPDEFANAADAAFECTKHFFAFIRKSVERRLARQHRFVPQTAASS